MADEWDRSGRRHHKRERKRTQLKVKVRAELQPRFDQTGYHAMTQTMGIHEGERERERERERCLQFKMSYPYACKARRQRLTLRRGEKRGREQPQCGKFTGGGFALPVCQSDNHRATSFPPLPMPSYPVRRMQSDDNCGLHSLLRFSLGFAAEPTHAILPFYPV